MSKVKGLTRAIRTVKSRWVNNTKPIWKVKDITKPCHSCGYCPYGTLVEEYPLKVRRGKRSCTTFGHDCPVYYQAEAMAEEVKGQ